MGASVAFYTVLSISPLVVLLLALVSVLIDRSSALQELSLRIRELIGPNAARALDATLESAQKDNGTGVASVVSVLLLLISASAVFVELRAALNKIWDVHPQTQSGLWGLVRERFFSFGTVLALGFLLLASLVASAVATSLRTTFAGAIPLPRPVLAAIDIVLSTLIIGALFTLTFRYMPETEVGWKAAWKGGLLTAVMFAVGKYFIGLYLAKAAIGSAYGAAGSVVVLLVWVYYSAQILFFGAEFTHLLEQKGERFGT
jgi:membrane protein